MFPLYDENRSRTRPIVTWSLIAINVLIFLYQVSSGEYRQLIMNYGNIPVYIIRGMRLYTLITSMFLHGGLWHLFGNMLYLYIFGDNVEDRFGHIRFLLLYMIFGVAGGLFHVLMSLLSGNLVDLMIPAVGASGAISGVLGAYIVFFPNARVVSIVFYFYIVELVPIPAYYFIGFWFLLQLLYAMMGTITGIAAWAHIGGFVAGMLVASLVKPKVPPREGIFEEYYWA